MRRNQTLKKYPDSKRISEKLRKIGIKIVEIPLVDSSSLKSEEHKNK